MLQIGKLPILETQNQGNAGVPAVSTQAEQCRAASGRPILLQTLILFA